MDFFARNSFDAFFRDDPFSRQSHFFRRLGEPESFIGRDPRFEMPPKSHRPAVRIPIRGPEDKVEIISVKRPKVERVVEDLTLGEVGEDMELDGAQDLVKEIGKQIYPKAFLTLDEGEDIASDCINTFFQILEKLHSKRVQVLDTYFAVYLSKWFQPEGHNCSEQDDEEKQELLRGLQYWESRIGQYTQKVDWKDGELVFVPIHCPEHWVLAVVNVKTLTVEFWDSSSCHNDGKWFAFWKEALRSWLTSANFTPAEFRQRVERRGLAFTFATRDAVHQTRGNDCGAFVCYYAERRSEGKSLSEVRDDPNCNPTYMNSYRKYLKQVLTPFVQ